jgi:hypothetical protein
LARESEGIERLPRVIEARLGNGQDSGLREDFPLNI